MVSLYIRGLGAPLQAGQLVVSVAKPVALGQKAEKPSLHHMHFGNAEYFSFF